MISFDPYTDAGRADGEITSVLGRPHGIGAAAAVIKNSSKIGGFTLS
ncbi:hypothetical protein [Oceanobacter kriegii]|nr:hypothetical protein [Oceanobacter kriegii]